MLTPSPPGLNQVAIRICASGVNPLDTKIGASTIFTTASPTADTSASGGFLSIDVFQANGTPPEWQSTAGFGKRLADTVGSSSIAAGIGFGLSTAFHMDPRYYRCTTCGFWGHLGSAAKQSFVYPAQESKAN